MARMASSLSSAGNAWTFALVVLHRDDGIPSFTHHMPDQALSLICIFARQTLGLSSFELRDIDPKICREMVEFYQKSNRELYDLMRETKSQAPPQQPDFIEFQVRSQRGLFSARIFKNCLPVSRTDHPAQI